MLEATTEITSRGILHEVVESKVEETVLFAPSAVDLNAEDGGDLGLQKPDASTRSTAESLTPRTKSCSVKDPKAFLVAAESMSVEVEYTSRIR